jgi:magnesium-transporting ATPase (P-type)
VRWDALEVGDLVKVQNREGIPADLVCLAVCERKGKPKSEPAQGLCYVETKSLDGETNLKLRQAMECTANLGDNPTDFMQMEGYIECETPNKGISKFTGKMCYKPLSGLAASSEPQTFTNPTLTPYETDVTPYNRLEVGVARCCRSLVSLVCFFGGCLRRVSLSLPLPLLLPLPLPWF